MGHILHILHQKEYMKKVNMRKILNQKEHIKKSKYEENPD